MIKKLINNIFETNILERFILISKQSGDKMIYDNYLSSAKAKIVIESINISLITIIGENNTLLFSTNEFIRHKNNEISLYKTLKDDKFMYEFSLNEPYKFLYGFTLKDYDEVSSLENLIVKIKLGDVLIFTKLDNSIM